MAKYGKNDMVSEPEEKLTPENEKNTSHQDKRRRNNKKRKNQRYSKKTRPAKVGYNDPKWYTRYPELLAAAATLPFPYKPGMDVPIMKDEYASGSSAPTHINIPGVLALEWAPTCGYSTRATDPASLAAKELYNKVRAAYSGRIYAGPPDFMIYLLALDSIYAYIGMLKRVYRVLNAFNGNNYHVPKSLMYALLGDSLIDSHVTELRSRAVELWSDINVLVRMCDRFTCPAVMDCFNRHYWMNDNIYADDNTLRSQLYVFRQKSYYRFSMVNTPEGVPAGGLIPLEAPMFGGAGTDPISTLYDYGINLIESLSNWESAYTISGYLSRAYEGTPSFTVELLPQFEQLNIQFQPEVLSQIENAMTVYPANREAGTVPVLSTTISQDPLRNVVLSQPTVIFQNPGTAVEDLFFKRPTFIMHSDVATALDVVIASRLTATCQLDHVEEGFKYYRILSGTEIPWKINIYTMNVFTHEVVKREAPQLIFHMYDGTEVETYPQFLASILINQWGYHPQMWYMVRTTDASYWDLVPVSDVHNLTSCTEEQLTQIHRSCILSEFDAFRGSTLPTG